MNKATFLNNQNVFFNELKAKVEAYFLENGLKQTGNFKLYFKTIVLSILGAGLYVLLVFFTPAWYISLPLSALLGLVLTSIGFNVMHDACHGSYSTKKWVNELMSLSMNALGSNAFFWKIKHNIVHHTFTNIDGIDDDIEKSPFMRFCESQPKRKAHRFQHIYAWFLYTVTTIYWMFWTDFEKFFVRSINGTPIRSIPIKEKVIFWISKILYFAIYIAIPVYFVGWADFLIGFFVMHATMGLALAIVFQLAHVVEGVEFEHAHGKTEKIQKEWAVHQADTTANFATNSKVLTWLLGGLNFQVEHHLFPRISHVHYPKLKPILMETFNKYGIKYNHFPTMGMAIVSHYKVLRMLGRN